MEAKLKHLEFVQNVIGRLSNKSFLARGWCITLIAAIFSLQSGCDSSPKSLMLLLLIVFFLLDSHYLYLERQFRGLYDEVADTNPANVNFSMRIDKGVGYWLKAMKSIPIVTFYSLFLLLILVFL